MIGGITWLAPFNDVGQVSRAIDYGCGTGVATVQLATILPSAIVYGVDISPIPEAVQKLAPSNAIWAQGNILDNDPTQTIEGNTLSREILRPQSLDYVFGRMLFLGINDWARYFSTVSQAMKSGSIIEHQDLDWKFYRVGTSECLSDNWEWHLAVGAATEKSGLSLYAGSGAVSHMENAGLEVIRVETFEFSFVPSKKTPNSQSMARYVQSKLMPQYPELLRKMLEPLGIKGEELGRLTEDCLRDLNSEEGIHQKYTVTIAKKP